MKIKLLILLLLASIGAGAQSWTSFGTGAIQRRIVGSDTTYRWVGGTAGTYVYGRSEWKYNQILNNRVSSGQTIGANTTGSADKWGGQIWDNQLKTEPFNFLVNNNGGWGYTGEAQVKEFLGINKINNTVDSLKNTFKYFLPADINHVISYGQSLSMGATAPAITLNAVSPYMLKFQNSYDATGTLEPLFFESGFAEIPVGGTAAALIELANTRNFSFSQTNMLFSWCGVGGASINDLNKGTSPYNNFLTHVTNGKNQADLLGKSYSLYAVEWTQGEADMLTMTPSQYQTILTQLRKDLNEDVKAITGQKNDVIFVMYQLSSFNNVFLSPSDYNKDFATVYPKMSREVEGFYMGNPNYDKTYTDGVHLNAISYKRMGAEYGVILDKLMTGKSAERLFITKHSYSGNVINLEFNKPFLEIDITAVDFISNYGFSLIGNTIDSIGVNNNRITIFTGSAVSPTDQLTYGFNATGAAGSVDGPRGNIRSSDKNIFSFGTTYDWLAHTKLTMSDADYVKPVVYPTLQQVLDSDNVADKQIVLSLGTGNSAIAFEPKSNTHSEINSYKPGVGFDHPLALNRYGGKVGIGKMDPQSALDVIGSIRASSNDGTSTAVVRNSDIPFENYLASGTGASTTITIPHGLTGITATSKVIVQPLNAASAGITFATIGSVNVVINYTVAPVSGTNNLNYSILIKK